jgi:sugar lactone lactonase YvrE/nicotinamidase-related amidase
MMRLALSILAPSVLMLSATAVSAQDSLNVSLRLQQKADSETSRYVVESRDESWQASETAIIVCDTWDLHHCLGAVRRLEQFAPRLDQVLQVARKKGVTIIHAPSDCMDAYRDHPARQRAIEVPESDYRPPDIGQWCSAIPAEEQAVYPIDQSDGGEDDDPGEHTAWAAKLKAMGRNPAMPWQKQSELITIDQQSDFITDRGDEVWSILQQRGIRNVVLTGVHTNMCVLGRPFGLRQLARNGKNVVLMRDMTDTMYNPQRWPYVSHFEGTRRVISHIERFVCPTITSDQFVGGEPFRFEGDQVTEDLSTPTVSDDVRRHWTTITVPQQTGSFVPPQGDPDAYWYRCVVHLPPDCSGDVLLRVPDSPGKTQAWCNGLQMLAVGERFQGSSESVLTAAPNLIVICFSGAVTRGLQVAPTVICGDQEIELAGHWQFRVGSDQGFSSMPLPAQFGGSADIVFSPPEPLWTPRVVTRAGEFTAGIEGPACDRDGNVFAVNYAAQGTIGKIRPNGAGEVFVDLPQGSIGNGIRFAPDGSFFVADYAQHKVLRVDPVTRKVSVHAHATGMSQPNDLAISPDGKTLFASDPNWSKGTGQLWRIDSDGTVTRLAEKMGTTNGIEVSPDAATLYVNESKQRNVWAFTITHAGTLADKRLVRKFEDHGFDGMRCDIDGNLYITRHGKGTVVKMSPSGEILREIGVLGTRPSNLCFGGPDKRTLYVTEVDFARLVSFRVDRPGRE